MPNSGIWVKIILVATCAKFTLDLVFPIVYSYLFASGAQGFHCFFCNQAYSQLDTCGN